VHIAKISSKGLRPVCQQAGLSANRQACLPTGRLVCKVGKDTSERVLIFE